MSVEQTSVEQTLQNIQDRFALDPSTNFKPSLANDVNDVYYLIQEAQNSITLAAQGREEANQPDKVSTLDGTFKQFVNFEHRLDLGNKTLNLLKQRINNGEKITDPIAYYEKIQQTLANEAVDDEARINSNQKYLAFKQQIWNVNHPEEMMPSLVSSNDDDDIVMGPTRISLKCPITTVWLDEPVTSNKCKHTYSKKAIYSLFPSHSHAIPCPIPGCSRTVARIDLKDDPVMADRVARAKQRMDEPDTTEFFDV
ncbi:zinc-finger of the MIZ type in Nse subunit-domain-containing protein [Parasitella parasitica]|nr:zinc-finger of the MIZ type in Nse subunit-domain-containing protein [Parasitella parasitica]